MADIRFTFGIMNEQATIPMAFARFGERGVIPKWASTMKAERYAAESLATAKPFGVWILQATDFRDLDRHKFIVGQLSERIAKSDYAVELVLHLAAAATAKSDRSVTDYLRIYRHFPELTGKMEIAIGKDDLMPRVLEAMAKCIATSESRLKHMDPLSAALEVQETRAALVSPKTGRLDAAKIADALGMSVAKLAKLMGRTRGTVTKTPDAPALQEKLRQYERILRLKARLPDEKLLAWLEAPNRHLDDHTPRSLIEDGRAEVVADLVEDALTGQPT